jgi:hypothetical protein
VLPLVEEIATRPCRRTIVACVIRIERLRPDERRVSGDDGPVLREILLPAADRCQTGTFDYESQEPPSANSSAPCRLWPALSPAATLPRVLRKPLPPPAGRATN